MSAKKSQATATKEFERKPEVEEEEEFNAEDRSLGEDEDVPLLEEDDAKPSATSHDSIDPNKEDNIFVEQANKYEVAFEKDMLLCIEAVQNKALLPRSLLIEMADTAAHFVENFKNQQSYLFEMLKEKLSQDFENGDDGIGADVETANDEYENLVKLVNSRLGQQDKSKWNDIYEVISKSKDYVELAKKIFKRLREKNDNYDVSGRTSKKFAVVTKKLDDTSQKNKRRFMLAVMGGQNAGKSTLLNEILGYNIVKTGAARMSKIIVMIKKPMSAKQHKKFVIVLKSSLDKNQVQEIVSEMKAGLKADTTDKKTGKNVDYTAEDISINTRLEQKYASDIESQLEGVFQRRAVDDTMSSIGEKGSLKLELSYNDHIFDNPYFQIYSYGFFGCKVVDHIVVYDDNCIYDVMDIPGTGSRDVQLNSAPLKEADLFILAKSCDDASLTDRDTVFADFLKNNALNKIVMVMTKADAIRPVDEEDVNKEIQNSFRAYKKECPTKLHDKIYLVSCDKSRKVSGNQLNELKHDINEMMTIELGLQVKKQLEEVVTHLKDINDSIKEEHKSSSGSEIFMNLDNIEPTEGGDPYEQKLLLEEKKKNIVANIKSHDNFRKRFKEAKKKLNESINTVAIYNMVPLRKKMIDIFLEQVGFVKSTGTSNVKQGTIKDLMKKLTGGSIAIDAEEANNKVRKLTNTSLQNILADSARKIGCFMHTTYIMNWVKVVSDTLGINASKELTFISEKEFSIKIETLIMHRAIPIIEYFVRWAEYRKDQRAYILDYLNELGINLDEKDSPVEKEQSSEKKSSNDDKTPAVSGKETSSNDKKKPTSENSSVSDSQKGSSKATEKKDSKQTPAKSSTTSVSRTSSKKDVAVDEEF